MLNTLKLVPFGSRHNRHNMDTLEKQLNPKHLLTLAGNTINARGQNYAESGAVTQLRLRNGKLHARVTGSGDYTVKLWANDEGLNYDCTCPMGITGECCKHVVATGLAWLAQDDEPELTDDDDITPIRHYLLKQSPQTLATWLIAQCEHDEALYNELSAKATRSNNPLDVKTLKHIIRDALTIHGFVDWRRVREAVRQADTVVTLIQELIQDGHNAVAAELADYAMQRGITAYSNVDDSGGEFGETLRCLSHLHLQAYQQAGANYPLQAKTLFKLQRLDGWDFFALQDYAPLLNTKEYAQYRKRVEKEWVKIPTRDPEDRYNTGFSSSDHYTITAMMKELATFENNLDELIAIESRDLSSAYTFLRIAEQLAEANRHDEALAWAERGLAAFPKRQDSRLIEYLTTEYQRRDRHQDALKLARKHFRQELSLSSYQHLHTTSKTSDDWPSERETSLTYLCKLKQTRKNSWEQNAQSLLIDIHLWEKNISTALTLAKTDGCNIHQWQQLAQACEKDHPQDAADIHRKLLDDILNQKNNRAYDSAVHLISTIQTLMQRSKQDSEFTEWLTTIRTQHKVKRNFMQRLDKALGKQHGVTQNN